MFNTVFADAITAVMAPDHSAGKKGGLSIAERFRIFDARNPAIYELLVARAYDASWFSRPMYRCTLARSRQPPRRMTSGRGIPFCTV
jgi:hypothetical protein